VTATFDAAGAGTVTVTCQGSTISLGSATPFGGWTLSVHSSGPTDVSVAFSSGRNQVSVHASCTNGQPTAVIDD
jgi:hypothetical protein